MIPFHPFESDWQVTQCTFFGIMTMALKQVGDDGNCFFRSIRFFVSRTEDNHDIIRAFLL